MVASTGTLRQYAQGDDVAGNAIGRGSSNDKSQGNQKDQGNHGNQSTQKSQDNQGSIIPLGALRPPGTLHFTLGVIHLPTAEALQRASALLDGLDLDAILHGAAATTAPAAEAHGTAVPSATSVSPPSISLTGLGALPRPRTATVLYALPSDPSGVLYPFATAVRGRFVEAGLMKQEMEVVMVKVKENKETGISRRETQGVEAAERITMAKAEAEVEDEEEAKVEVEEETEPGADLKDGAVDAPVETSQGLQQQEKQSHRPRPKRQKELRPRPLLLHATVANTLYAGKRRVDDRQNNRNSKGSSQNDKRSERSNGKGRPDKVKKDTIKIDARPLLRAFNTNAGISIPGTEIEPETETTASSELARAHPPRGQTQEQTSAGRNTKAGSDINLNANTLAAAAAQPKPFIWARDIVIDRVCICEMGAKPVENPALGQAYRIVAEKRIGS